MVKQGDIIKLNFNPQTGHKQAGYRPAVVLSNDFLHFELKAILFFNNVAPFFFGEQSKNIDKAVLVLF